MARRVWGSAVAAYGVTQAVLALGAFLRIPVLVETLGPDGYGAIIVVTSAWTIANVLADGLSQTSRVLVAEDRQRDWAQNGILKVVGGAARIEAAFLLATAVGAVLALEAVGVFEKQGHLDNAWPWIIVAAGATVALVLAPYRGALEGHQRVVAVNISGVANVLIGLPLLLILLRLWPTFQSAVAATVVGVVSPYVICAIMARRSGGRMGRPGRSDRRGVAHALHSSSVMTLWAFANVMVYAFDPVIVGGILGLRAAGEYGLASRVMTLGVVVPLALGGLLTSKVATWRATGDRALVQGRLRSTTFLFAACGLLTSVASGALGPILGQLVGGNSVGTPRQLYWWLATFGFLVTASAPLMAACAGPALSRLRAVSAVIQGLAIVVLSFLLTPALGVSGPVIASVACNGVLILFFIWRIWMNRNLLMGVYFECEPAAVKS